MTDQSTPRVSFWKRPKRRWGDNDRHFGPFTFAFRESWRPLAALLSSGGEGRGSGCHIRLQAFGATLICELPPIVKPHRRWVDTSHYEWSKSPDGGYWDEHPNEYGVSLNEGHLSVSLGAQTMDSSTTKDWGCFLPWTQWRQIAHRAYGSNGGVVDLAALPWREQFAAIEELPKTAFLIADYDGEQITATTYAEEREMRLGTGWFKWLGYLTKRKRSRDLRISFDKETGREKGSWKGGTVGTSIDMLPEETAEQAFRRYCEEEHRSKSGKYTVTFIGPAGAKS